MAASYLRSSYLRMIGGACPALPGLVTEGDTMEEARAMAQDAIRAYIESLRKDHPPAPADKPPVKEEIRVLAPEPA